ncbi:SURF1 family protein [Pseudogemmobacter sonorensis]|uniref:SURF1 family protein n=1 Tax=Pseudogemmobacter sonorensis TaxID=2989681 RepID=UPI0036A519C9
MMRQILFVLVVGLCGIAVLTGFGLWQLQRLEWKEGLIAEAEAMIVLDPVPLPVAPGPARDRYRAVEVEGRFTGAEAHVLTSTREWGPGFLVIAAFLTADGRPIMVERGYVPETAKTAPRPPGPARVTGNLHWPEDITSATPAPDPARGIWFGRDLDSLAAHLGTEPILVVARSPTGQGVQPVPVTAVFRNNHLGYAVQWFGLAIVWAGMTLAYLWRITRREG